MGKKRVGKKKKQRRIIISFLALLAILAITLGISIAKELEKQRKEKQNQNTETETQTEIAQATETESQVPLVSEEPEPEIVTVTISGAGDCTFGPVHQASYDLSFHEVYDTKGPDWFFQGVKPIFEKDDFTLVNLECALTNATEHMDKEFCLKGKPEYAAILPAASIEGVSMANNHYWDYFDQGIEETIQAVTSNGIEYALYDKVGTYTTGSGITIGWVSSSFLNYSKEREDFMENGIKALKEQNVDIIIACCHWGIERTYYPEDYQVNLAHKVIDWGADLILGCHPHVVQGAEIYNGKVIMYSMGNFCFGGNKNPSDKNSYVYQQTFTFVDGVLQEDINAKIYPCTISSVSNINDYQPTPVEGEKKAEIIGLMNEYSAPYQTVVFDEDGNITRP